MTILIKGVLGVYLEVSDVGLKEADEGKSKGPFRDCADDVCSIALKDISHISTESENILQCGRLKGQFKDV